MTSPITPSPSQRPYRTSSGPERSSSSPKTRPSTEAKSSASLSQAAKRPDLGENLSAAEEQMIHKQFPPSPETTMRIYGRDRGEQKLQPDALGQRLDIRG